MKVPAFREVSELADPCYWAQPGTGGVDFDGGHGGGECRAPVPQVLDTGGAQQVGPQVALHHPQFAQRVGDRCSGGEGGHPLNDLAGGDSGG
jgi:hypothetical protein